MARTTGAFSRAASRLQHHGGDEAVLRGAQPTTAILEHNVATIGDQGETIIYAVVAGIPTADRPRIDDSITFTATGKTWVIDAIIADDSYLTRVALRP